MITGAQLRDCIISGAYNISNQKASVDELNVFPVPDGDTGTNMSMTIGNAVRELQLLADDTPADKVASTAASGLLRGARGNSGVILSLIFRGFSKGLQGCAEVDASALSRSLTLGVEMAYKAVMKPTEGTILTVARVAAQRTAERIEAEGDIDTTELFGFIVDTCRETLATTPDILPVLKKAGVVDAGGQGLVVIFEGMLSVLRDGIMISDGVEATVKAPADNDKFEIYHTDFTVKISGSNDAAELRVKLEAIGNKVSVDDNGDRIKCSVETRRPDKALREALLHGNIENVTVMSLYEKGDTAESESETAHNDDSEFPYIAVDPSNEYGFVSVSSGEGIKSLFEELGVNNNVSGGQTMNPSTDDILAAVQATPAKNVFVLANNKNIIMAAEQACALADRKAVVIPTRTIPQGITAMLAFDPTVGVRDNVVAMKDAAEQVSTGSVTFAARDSDFDGKQIKQGDILAMDNGKLVYVENDVVTATVKLAKKLCKKNTCSLTLIYGADVSDEDAENAVEQIKTKIPKNIEVSLINGAQPVYYFYISAE